MDAKLKHLEFLQSAIARMATNSSLYKGWAVTVAAALSALATVKNRAAVMVVTCLATLIFWGLDAYYLWLERQFVELYNRAANQPADKVDFSMRIDKSDAPKKWLLTCLRPHLVTFYFGLFLIGLIGALFLKEGIQ